MWKKEKKEKKKDLAEHLFCWGASMLMLNMPSHTCLKCSDKPWLLDGLLTSFHHVVIRALESLLRSCFLLSDGFVHVVSFIAGFFLCSFLFLDKFFTFILLRIHHCDTSCWRERPCAAVCRCSWQPGPCGGPWLRDGAPTGPFLFPSDTTEPSSSPSLSWQPTSSSLPTLGPYMVTPSRSPSLAQALTHTVRQNFALFK